MANQVNAMLDRLHGVKPRGNGRWLARCPAHDDKTPSLSIGTGDNGAVLIRCWRGCSAHEIVTAVGLNLSDLFPPRESTGAPIKRPWPASIILETLLFEVEIIGMAAGDIFASKTLSDSDRQRFSLAIQRVLAIYAEVQTHGR